MVERLKNELGEIIAKREAELARVREQRDQRDAELKERKSRDAVKSQALHEFKVLADTRMVRVVYVHGIIMLSVHTGTHNGPIT